MGNAAEIREGWRLFLPYAAEVVTPRRRRLLALANGVGGVAVAAVTHTLVAGEPEAARVLFALCAAIATPAIWTWILLAVWRRKLPKPEKFRGDLTLEAEVSHEIRTAYAEGRVPDLPNWQRHRAADLAERSRTTLPSMILTQWPAVALLMAMPLGATAILIGSGGQQIAPFAAIFGFAAAAVNGPVFLMYLGRTTAPIETRPEGEPEPAPRSKPYRQLGTDHPDDYVR